MKRLFPCVLLCALAHMVMAGPALAGGKSSTGWTIFRKLQSVKPTALSAAHYFPGDISGVLHNPSLLAFEKGQDITVMGGSGYFDEKVAGALYGTAAGGWSLGGGLFSYDYGKMELNWIENNEIKERTVSAQSDCMGLLSAARPLTDKLNAGVNIKAASSRIADEATAYAFAVDAGVNYALHKKLLVSLVGQNIGTATKFIDKSEALPTAVMPALSYLDSLGEFYFLGGVEAPYLIEEEAFKPSVAVEVGRYPFGIFAGYRTYADDAELSYGLSLSFKDYDFSYSYTPAKWLDSMHRLAIGIKLGQPRDVRDEVKRDYQQKAPEREKRRQEKARAEQEKARAAWEKARLEQEALLKEQERARLAREAQQGQREQVSVLPVQSHGPKDIVLDPLNAQPASIASPYCIEEVVDEREGGENLTTLRTGPEAGSSAAVRLRGGAAAALGGYFARLLPRDAGKVPLVVRVKELKIESTGAGRYTRVRAKLEFLAKNGTVEGLPRTVEIAGPERWLRGTKVLSLILRYETDMDALLRESVESLRRK